MKESIAFTGGGTGGHVFPGLAVAEQLLSSWAGEVFWIGSGNRMERSLVEKWKIPYYPIPSGKLRRYLSFKNFIDVFKIGAGCIASLFLLARKKPKVIFSKGGFVSVPPVLAARVLRIPIITHESDSDPGLATRINSRWAAVTCISWKQTAEYFPQRIRTRVRYTGNPVRQDIFLGDGSTGRRLLSIEADAPVVFVLGGSLGAREINNLVSEHLNDLLKIGNIIHQTGGGFSSAPAGPGYHPFPFIGDELPHYLAASDLVISRAGANILCELAALGKPALLLPLEGSATRGDQERNARMFADAGAAVIYSAGNRAGNSFSETVTELMADKKKLSDMGKAAASLIKTDAASAIKNIILEYAGG